MSRAIKVDDNVYSQLDQLRGKGETYSMAVESLLNARLKMLELISVLEGQIKYREWQDERLKALSAVDR
uniref:Antitoxin n=1 Tax=viral metagenome TaxID=1070528 RepID=A0A6H2A3K0_9ZZZZ